MSEVETNIIWQLSWSYIQFINVIQTISSNSRKQLMQHSQKIVDQEGTRAVTNFRASQRTLMDNFDKLKKLMQMERECMEITKKNNLMIQDGTKAMKETEEWHIRPNAINDSAKQMLESLIFGYIHELIEDKHNMMIPYYLKMVCLEFHGNIIMDTNILNMTQLNTFEYVLRSSFNKKGCKHFYTQKIYDSTIHGFDSKLFNTKCGALRYDSIIIFKTNQNHICAYYQPSRGEIIGCLLNSGIPTIPTIYDEHNTSTHHFPDDFEANCNEKVSEIVTKEDEFDGINNFPYFCIHDIDHKFCISDFEIFTVQ